MLIFSNQQSSPFLLPLVVLCEVVMSGASWVMRIFSGFLSLSRPCSLTFKENDYLTFKFYVRHQSCIWLI